MHSCEIPERAHPALGRANALAGLEPGAAAGALCKGRAPGVRSQYSNGVSGLISSGNFVFLECDGAETKSGPSAVSRWPCGKAKRVRGARRRRGLAGLLALPHRLPRYKVVTANCWHEQSM